MKIAARIMAAIGIFAVPIALLYWFLSYEESGTAMLGAFGAAALFLATYLHLQSRNRPSPPEDQTEPVAPAEEDIGVFPSASIWPLVLGFGVTILAFGFAYNRWLSLPGLGVAVIGLAGMVVESARIG